MVFKMKEVNTVVLAPTQRLISITKREWHTRKQRINGIPTDVAYVAIDRLAKPYEPAVVITQKLSLLARWINARADNRGSRVSITALYVGTDRSTDSRDGEFIKGRYHVKTVNLATAAEEFERVRNNTPGAILAAEPSCYTLHSEINVG